jgi:large subunit ribosomal protein L30e
MDVNRALRTAVQTGKVLLGGDQTRKAIEKGEAKLIVLSSNHPEAGDIESVCNEKGVPVYRFMGRGTDLGPAIGKPFAVGVLAVVDPGESDVMGLKRGTA